MNILFITADQWRADCLSKTGRLDVKTPHLDRLATDGVTFKNHFAQATPCGPARACLYTGMYLQNNRSLLNGTPMDSRHTNIALEVRKKGYEPVLFGYTDISLDPDGADYVKGGYEGVLPGMTENTLLTGDWKLWLADLKEKGYDIPKDCWDMFRPDPEVSHTTNKGKTFSPARFKAKDSPAAFLVDKAADYISKNQKNSDSQPWFVHLSFYAPHPPFIAPAPYHDMYNSESMPSPIRRDTPHDEASQHPWLEYYLSNQRGSSYTHDADSRHNLEISDKDLRQIKATYYGMITEVDMQIGRLLDHLRKLDCYEDTLIIFTSDHGEYLGDHWMLGKSGYFDQPFHVPLIIRAPISRANSARGSIVDAFSESIDIMPTILKAIGADIPNQCDGASLLPYCYGNKPEKWRKEYHAEFDLRSPYEIDENIPLGLSRKDCAVNILADNRYKYVHFNGLPALFFDREKDPNEFHDVSNDPAYQGRVLEYVQKMLTWRMNHDDPALTHLHLDENGAVMKVKEQ